MQEGGREGGREGGKVERKSRKEKSVEDGAGQEIRTFLKE